MLVFKQNTLRCYNWQICLNRAVKTNSYSPHTAHRISGAMNLQTWSQNKKGEVWKDPCPTLVNPLKECHMTAPAQVWKQDSSAHVGLSACQQVSPVTARPELDLKGNAIKYTGYSWAWVTGNKSKYQCGLSLFCWM